MVNRICLGIVVIWVTAVMGSVSVFAAAHDKSAALVDGILLDEAGLEMVWQTTLPVEKGEGIDRLFVYDQYLYVLTGSNYMVCMDRAKGTMRFGVQLAEEGLWICPPIYAEGKLWFMIGTTLKILDPFSGVIKDAYRFTTIGRSSVCNMSRNDSHLFVAGSERRLNALHLDGFWRDFQVTAQDNSLITSLVADNKRVVFATEEGTVYAISAQGPKKLWEYDVIGEIQARIMTDKVSVYVSSMNTKLYRLDIATGQMLWDYPFQAGAQLLDPVRVGSEVVYQPAGINGLYAVDRADGTLRWQVPDGVGMITEIENRAYLMARNGVLVVMDNSKREKIRSVNFAAVTDFAYNDQDGVIYVADEAGRVAAIVEQGAKE